MKQNTIMQQLRSNAVTWKMLGEAAEIADNARKPVKASLRIAGENPYYGANNIQDYVEGYTHDGEYILIAEDGSASLENYSIQWANGKFWANNHVHVVRGKENLNNRFLFHYLRQMNFISYLTGGDRAKLTKAKMVEIKIPIPPLELQKNIVKTLDKLTELEATLEAELSLRVKQYEYYRDLLLTFDESHPFVGADIKSAPTVVWKKLGEVAKKISSGGTPLSTRSEYYDGDIPWLRTQEVKFSDISETEIKITQAGLDNSSAKWIPENCVIIAISGATAGRSAINKIPLTTNQHCCNIEVDPEIAYYRYVFYWVSKEYENLKALGQGARADLNAGIIKNYLIPIPNLQTQQKIIEILDKFDRLTNSIKEGLPKEIELRRKQYEYYREKLLSFKWDGNNL